MWEFTGGLCNTDFCHHFGYLLLQPSFFQTNSRELSPMVRYCAVSNIEQSHRTAITDIQWVPDHIEVSLH